MMAMNFKFSVPKFLKSVRYSLFAVNTVFLLTGILFFLIGVIVLVKFSEYDELISNKFISTSRYVIATAVIILLISGFGFYAAISKQFYFIAGYVVLLLVILVFDIVILILGYSLMNNATSEIGRTMEASRQFYGSRIEITQMWDDLQMGFECCGTAGRFDWISNQIPVSCCHIDYGTISPFTCDTANAHQLGCSTALGEYLAHQAQIIGITAAVVTSFQVLLVALEAGLAWRSRSEEVELES